MRGLTPTTDPNHPNGLPQQIMDSATGDIVEFLYDTNQRPSSIKVNTQTVLTTAYDIKGNLQSSLDASGRLMQFSYDGLNRLTREVGADNSFTAYQWACCFIEVVRSGEIVGGNEKTLRRTITIHDARALPQTTTDSDGNVTRYVFDIAGRFTKLTDPKGQETQWEYSNAGQLKKKIYPGASFEEFTYVPVGWGMGKISSFKNRRGATTNLSYEYDGQLDTVGKPNGEGGLAYDYDTWRRPKTIAQDAGGGYGAEIHTFAHDLLGRVTTIDGPWTDDTIFYAYNDATRAVTRTSPGGMTQTTTANSAGQTASIANILGTFSNTYDGLGGALTSITHSGANAGFNTAFTYHGDAFDRALATLTATKPGGATIGKHSYTYDTSGNIATWKREAPLANPTGLTRQFDSKVFYDRADQVSSVIHTPLVGSSVVESAQHYVYDAAGNIASRQVETPAAASTMVPYTHNALNQLTGIGGSSGARPVTVRGSTSEPAKVKAKTGAISSSWKNARMLEGNRFEADLDLANGANSIQLQAKDGSGNQSNYSYALTLAAASSAVPTYDADGNMTSDGERNFEWDSQSRLTKIYDNSIYGITYQFKYNGLGQRATRIETSQPSGYPVPVSTYYHHLYDGIHLLDRRTGNASANSSTITRRYFSQGEQRKIGALWDSYYYTRDHLGSIREVVKSDGTLAVRYDYDPYGKRSVQYQSSTYVGACDLGFTGHITLPPSPYATQAELVLTFYRAYAPELGRWLSADPIGEEGGLNLYGYVENSPTNYSDPLGLYIGAPGGEVWHPLAHEGTDEQRKKWGDRGAMAAAGVCAMGGVSALPTAAIAIGPGAKVSSAFPGFHVAFGSGGNWLHATGGPWAMRVLGGRRAMEFATKEAWLRIPIPVISTAAVNSTKGDANFCVTAAARGIARGWVNPIVDYFKSFFN